MPVPDPHLAYTTLIIDDDESIRHMLNVVLSRTWAFRVVGEAPDAPAAIALLDDPSFPRPDVILLDFLMPKMTGAEAEPELRKRAPGTKIIVLTVVPERCEEVPGRDGCVDKALLPAQLVHELYHVVSGSTPSDEDLFT